MPDTFPVGTRVVITAGPRAGRVGVVARVPKMTADFRYVNLEATKRARPRKWEFLRVDELALEAGVADGR